MILRSWADHLSATPWRQDVIEFHVADTVAAFLAGIRTREGQALACLGKGRTDVADLSSLAAAVVRLTECDDIHLASCITPGSVVVPVALALAGNCSMAVFARAIAAGYAAGITFGLAIGGTKALAEGVWPTLCAAPL